MFISAIILTLLGIFVSGTALAHLVVHINNTLVCLIHLTFKIGNDVAPKSIEDSHKDEPSLHGVSIFLFLGLTSLLLGILLLIHVLTSH